MHGSIADTGIWANISPEAQDRVTCRRTHRDGKPDSANEKQNVSKTAETVRVWKAQ